MKKNELLKELQFAFEKLKESNEILKRVLNSTPEPEDSNPELGDSIVELSQDITKSCDEIINIQRGILARVKKDS